MNEIFRKRRNAYYARTFKYLRYVFNDHFLLFLLIGIGALGVAYTQFLQHFSLVWWQKVGIIGIVSVASLSIGKLATFVAPADSVFLLAKESEIENELTKAVRHSLAFPAAFSVLFVALSAPALHLSVWVLGLWLLGLLIVKFVLLQRKLKNYDTAGVLDWLRLTADETRRQTNLLKIYAQFTSVKGLSHPAKRRKFLDFLLPKRPKNEAHFLLVRTFLRSGDYLTLTLRLTSLAVIGSLAISQIYFALIFAFVMNYLLLFQLLGLRDAHANQPLQKIYPVSADSTLKTLQGLIVRVFTGVVALEVLVLLISHLTNWPFVVLFGIIMPLLARFYVMSRLK
ncbi:MAG: ABC transporter permease [Streptococcaceae bacterium]|jgi:ABC-2 type transport system permease protein|nr:ABC transporter permease [Streptococcaceae bacterium]